MAGPMSSAPPLRLLFVLRARNFDRVFENALRALLERGHELRVVYGSEKRRLPDGAGLVFEALECEFDTFSFAEAPPRTDGWARVARALRLGGDYLRYLEPEYERATALRARAAERAPRLLRGRLGRSLRRRPAARSAVARALASLERALPVPADLIAFVLAWNADAVLVSPLVGLGSPQVDWLRAARAAGAQPMLLVASWDNLTNKGLVRGDPALTVVWNDRQIEEAVRLHGVPRERVVAVGAHAFDHWFAWERSSSFAEFAARVGLDPDRPFLLYAGSSSFIAGHEADFVSEWVRRLRESGSETLRTAGVLVRPHPQNIQAWSDFGGEPGSVVVWPRGGAVPTDEQRKRDYYDSLHHSSGVVGINTSALVEAAIVGRPVFTLADGHFGGTQEGTLHFEHLTGTHGDGLLVVARSWEDHLAQLDAALADPALHAVRIEGFVQTFVRPRGRDIAAAALLADAVERAVAEPVARPRRPLVGRVLLWVLRAATH